MKTQASTTTFISTAGHLMVVRPIRPDDAPLLVEIFEYMTAESRYRRYHQTLDHVSAKRVWKEALNIANADSNNNRGFIAFTDLPNRRNVPVGAARFVRTGPEEAEVAISIRDDFQNLGIGTQLMRLLAEEAHALGYRRLIADIQNDNPAIWHVFKSLPYHIIRSPEGSNSNIIVSLNSLPETAG